MKAVTNHAPTLGIAPVCAVLDLPRASYYRQLTPQPLGPPVPRPTSARALAEDERQTVLTELHSKRFIDTAPAQVVATLLDEGVYHCSTRTMYRILESKKEVRERRNQLSHPQYKKPELLATAPNQVWSWDITKLRGPAKWTYFYLYVILDIFSRYVVGWMVAHRETAELAKRLIAETCERQGIVRDQLTLHADRGSPMKAKCTAQLLADLGITKSHSRPYVSDDNPFSESQFKTLKYRPNFPDRFGCQQDSRSYCTDFFNWYNNDHRHSGLAMLTPHTVHYGQAEELLCKRHEAMLAAYLAHPERFVKGMPQRQILPEAVWINPPEKEKIGEDEKKSLPEMKTNEIVEHEKQTCELKIFISNKNNNKENNMRNLL